MGLVLITLRVMSRSVVVSPVADLYKRGLHHHHAERDDYKRGLHHAERDDYKRDDYK